MDRYEYRVVSVADGQYTSMLNQYGAEGWELVTVAHDVRTTPEVHEGGGGSSLSGIPMPSLGKFSKAASKLGELDKPKPDPAAPVPGTVSTTLLWVLRRPLPEEWNEADWQVEVDEES